MIPKDDFEKDMAVIEANVKQLIVLYEDYFCGKIYREPKEIRFQTETLIQKWRARTLSKASARFRFQTLLQRFNTFKEKWDRQLRIKEREEGGEIEL
jgi:hypothetical protein